MKKFVLIILCTLCFAVGASAQTPAVVAGDNVCLRARPSENSKLTGPAYHHFFTGDRVTVFGSSGNYYKISYNGRYYYLPKRYVRLRGNENYSSGYAPRYVVVAGDNVCLRARPNEGSKMTGPHNPHLYTGECYECVGVSGNYYKINYHGYYYYLPKRYGRPRN